MILALIATVIFAIAAFDGSFGDVHMVALGSAFMAAHFVVGEWSPWRR